MKKFLLVVALLILPNISHAAEFVPYLGIFGGYSALKDNPIENKEGFTVGGKVIGSLKTDFWYFDLGGGYEYEKLFSNTVDIETAEGFVEVDPRYRLSEYWSLGPVAEIRFGTDNQRDEFENTKRGLLSAGLKVVYEMKSEGNPNRIELNLQRSVTEIRGGDYYVAILGFQVGFPWDKEKKKPAPQIKQVALKPQIIYAQPVIIEKTIVVEKPDVVFQMKDSVVGFKTGKYDLNKKTRASLEKLSQFLSANTDKFSRIEIAGHTDSRGGLDYNQDLSEKRANVVKDALVKSGLSEDLISSKGYNYSMPIDEGNTEDAWVKNRRTEIQVFGVKDPTEFNNQVEKIMGSDTNN